LTANDEGKSRLAKDRARTTAFEVCNVVLC
jgi:hypothetical protein